MKKLTIILIAFLAGVTFFSVFQYVTLLKERVELLSEVSRARKTVSTLQYEKLGLLQEREAALQTQEQLRERREEMRQVLRAGSRKITRLRRDLSQTEEILKRTSEERGVVRSETRTLHQRQQQLQQQLAALEEENRLLKAQLASAEGIKGALREVRRQLPGFLRQVRRKSAVTQDSVYGNRGYLLRDGKSTYQGKPKISVDILPAD